MRVTARFCGGAVAVVMLLTAQAVRAQEAPSVDEIVKKANHVAYYQGKDGRAKVTMTIRDAQKNVRTREFTILRRDGDGKEDRDQKFYVYFHRPADVNKMAFLVWKHVGKDDDRWLYLPALDLVKRIAASDERTSFVGSDFFYEDVSGRGIEEDKHELLKTTKDFYLLKNTPIKTESVEFSYYTMWIHRKTFIPVKIEYYDKRGQKYREYTAKKVDKVDRFDTVTISSMKDIASGSETTLTYDEVKYDVDLDDDIFTARYLKRPPRRHLR